MLRAFVSAFLLVTAGAAAAQTAYPNKPIRLVVPWPPGGAVDVITRHLAERMTTRLGQTAIVENRPGATGQIGSRAVIQAAPDGYTLLVMSATVHSFSPNLAKAYPFDTVDDFTAVSQIVSFPYVMVVSSASPYKSVTDLVEAAKKSPGKLAYGSFGQGSAPYLISELFAMTTGTQLLHVPYKGAAQALTELVGGELAFMIDSLPSPLPQIRGGKLRALSVTTPARTAVLPDVPTIGETVKGFEAISWLGIGAPPKTPREPVQKLHDALREIAAEADYGQKLRQIGADPVASASPEAFREFLLAQRARWGQVVRDAKIPLSD